MYAEMFLVAKAGQYGIGHTAIPNLNSVPVFNNTSYVFPNLLCNIVRRARLVFQQWFIMLNNIVDIFNMYETISMNSRHIRVHLGHDHSCIVCRSSNDIQAYTETHIAMAVRGRNLNQRHLNRNKSSIK